jgi:hypothetical protein
MAAQQAAIAAAADSRGPGIAQLSARAGRDASRPAEVGVHDMSVISTSFG